MTNNVQKMMDFATCPDSTRMALETFKQWEKEKILTAQELQLVREFREKQERPQRLMPLYHR